MNYGLFKEKIKQSGIKKEAFKNAIGCTYNTLNRKLDGKSEFTINELNILANMLDLSRTDRLKIFFGK